MVPKSVTSANSAPEPEGAGVAESEACGAGVPLAPPLFTFPQPAIKDTDRANTRIRARVLFIFFPPQSYVV